MTTLCVKSKRFLLSEIVETLREPEPMNDDAVESVSILADDGSNTGVIPHLGESSWLTNPPAPVLAPLVPELREFSQAVFCGESAQIVTWLAQV